jgi:hypothetical protein
VISPIRDTAGRKTGKTWRADLTERVRLDTVLHTMTTLMRRSGAAGVVGLLPLTTTSCGVEMTWEQKVDALRKAGERGAEAHYVLLTQNKPPTPDTCQAKLQEPRRRRRPGRVHQRQRGSELEAVERPAPGRLRRQLRLRYTPSPADPPVGQHHP